MVKFVNSKFISFVFYCFVNFLCILLFLFLMYLIVFMIVLFFVIWSWLMSRHKKLCKWPKRQTFLEHFKKISNFHVFCTQTYAKCKFGAILCWRASTKRHVTLRPMVRFSQTWYQKMRKTWKKKLMKRHVAICGGCAAVARQSRISYSEGSNWPPSPS